MELKKCFVIILLAFFTININAQTKLSLNYYSEDVLNKIEASPSQRSEIKEIRSELYKQLSEIKNNVNLAEDEKNVKNKQAYKEAYVKYNKAINENQRTIIRRLLHAIQEENVKNGFSSFYESSHYMERMELFKQSPLTKKSVIFLGNSITEQGKWQELIPDKIVANRGIGGDNTYGVLSRLNEIIESEPEKIFLMIGINDIGSRLWEVSLVMRNYRQIINQIITGTPKTELYIQSLLPLNDSLLKTDSYKNKADTILKLNDELRKLALEKKVNYVDLHKEFHPGNNVLEPQYSKDGIHLLPAGYTLCIDFLRKNKYL